MPITKETILAEIRRLAKSNGGVPPGRLTLESESGIRETAWRGVYWAKWSEAVREAGFEPNKVTAAYPNEHLLELLAQVTRELGHVPTYSELRLKTRTAPGFPAEKTFARLGSKPEQVAQVLVFCRSRQGYDDVITICERAVAALPEDGQDSTASTEGDGIVYLLKSGRRYKFGFTNDLERRIRELTHQTSEPINKVHSIRTDDPSGIEAYWKNRFASKCVHNEWFTLTAKDVAAFKRRKKFM
jgi:hypothetical protein